MEKTDPKWDVLLELIEKSANYYNHSITRLAWNYYDENQKFCLYKIEYSKDPDQIPDTVKNDYGNFKLIKRTLSIEDSKGIITNIRNNKLPIDNDILDVSCGTLTQHFIPSGKSLGLIDTEWPTHYFECLPQSPPFQSIRPYVLNAKLNLPLYSTTLDAIIDFLDVNIQDSSVSSRIIVMIPDFRARIKELHIIGKRLSAFLETTGVNDSELMVKFYCKRQSKKGWSSQEPKNNTAEHIEQFEPDYARVVLFLKSKDNGEMLDEKIFEGLYTSQKGIVIKTPENYIDEIIKQGENDRIEFKTTIDDELFETLVSFANTYGGLIILGVDDKANIRGLAGDESTIVKKLFGLVKSHCEPMVDFKTEWITTNNQTLLLINVYEGKDKPYNDKGIIYIREGEHDFPIDRRKLDEIYRNKYNAFSTES